MLANDRCDQENLIGQLKGGVKAMTMPVGDLVSNWAYMVMASLAWGLKAWAALLLPEGGRWKKKYRAEKRSMPRMEFRAFCVALIEVPCQVVRGGRRCCIGCCRGIRGRAGCYAWWSVRTVAACVESKEE